MKSIHTLLVANRGEIARRIFRTCRSLGIRTVAVHSDADAELPFVREADVAVRLGPGPAAQSYLRADLVLAAARRTGADAIHPGYGFLSENADFAQAVLDAGLLWVGPTPAAIRGLGDKATARQLAALHGVPTVPGYDGEAQDEATFRREAEAIGVPVLIKASAGGGGRGMRRVDDLADLGEALASARREAESAFGNGRLLLERYVLQPRHIEVQVIGDRFGKILHLGERECSIQRRHQKILEEAPSPVVDQDLRDELGAAAVRVAQAVGYQSAGTIEFVMGQDRRFYFLEMNTRLQVEHPVTELVTGLDLVAMQIRVAEGAPIEEHQDDIRIVGHAIEARLCAEDPNRDWMPASGRLVRFDLPERDGVRVDAGFEGGDEVPSYYDSMLAKVIAWGPDRAEANRRLRAALDEAWVPGIVTNLPLLRDVVRDEDWVAGKLDTSFLGRRGLPRVPPAHLEEGARLTAAWSAAQRAAQGQGGAWRLWGSEVEEDRFSYGDQHVLVRTRAVSAGFEVAVGEAAPVQVRVLPIAGDRVRFVVDGQSSVVRVARASGAGPLDDGDALYLHLGSGEAYVRLEPRFPAPANLADEPGACVAPTPAVVRAVHVAEGQAVAQGAPLVTLEAMKMEHVLRAAGAGVVRAVRCVAGQAVEAGALLVRVEVAEA